MSQRIIVDPESTSLGEHPAVIDHAKRRRKRFPEGCVTLMTDVESARANAAPDQGRLPAIVYGPSVSSESQRVYYLVRWLDQGP